MKASSKWKPTKSIHGRRTLCLFYLSSLTICNVHLSLQQINSANRRIIDRVKTTTFHEELAMGIGGGWGETHKKDVIPKLTTVEVAEARPHAIL